MNNLDKHISYTAVSEVRQICNPLLKRLNLSYFGYSWRDKEGYITGLNSDVKMVESFKHANNQLTITQLSKGKHLWRSFKPRSVLNFLNEELGCGEVISLFYTVGDVDEVFTFAASADNHRAIELFMNHGDLLERFILYFKSTAQDLLQRAIADKAHAAENLIARQKFQPYVAGDILSDIKSKNIPFQTPLGLIWLTDTQMRYLSLYSKGFSCVEIGKMLCRSTRTIENHLANIRKKLKVRSKKELMALYQSNFMYL